ncbi:MAG TPA: TatD family hydrolase, partial [Chitinophagales bacterium]|nr:TatD family hydrolase [Chitinophagales bacterium]
MNHLVDTHAHLYYPMFDRDRADMLQRAKNNGVTQIYLPNVDAESMEMLVALVQQYPQQCKGMAGVHPCSVKADFETELQQAHQELEQTRIPIYGIGETGLDYYWDLTFVEQQKESLKKHISWAKKYNLPIILHTRNAFQDTFDLIAQHHTPELKGIFHCFSDDLQAARQVIELGNFYMGIGGTLTYKKSELPEVIAAVDLQYIVLETDAPYLAPEPYRSAKNPAEKRNESAYVVNVAQRIAEIKKLSMEKVANSP